MALSKVFFGSISAPTPGEASGLASGSSSAAAVGAGLEPSISAAVGSAAGTSTVYGPGDEVVDDLPIEILVEMGLGGSYRNWLKNRGTCVRHWFLGDSATIQARDEMTDAAVGDGIYHGSPSNGYGMLPEYGLSTTFDGGDDKVAVASGLSGIGGVFSLVAIYRPDALGMGTPRTIKRTGVAGAAHLGVTSADKVAFGVYGTSGTKLIGATALVADRAYLIAASYDGADARLFVADIEANEVIVEAGPLSMTFTSPHGAGMIGAEV